MNRVAVKTGMWCLADDHAQMVPDDLQTRVCEAEALVEGAWNE